MYLQELPRGDSASSSENFLFSPDPSASPSAALFIQSFRKSKYQGRLCRLDNKQHGAIKAPSETEVHKALLHRFRLQCQTNNV